MSTVLMEVEEEKAVTYRLIFAAVEHRLSNDNLVGFLRC